MSPRLNSPLRTAQYLVVCSRPQNVVFSGVLATSIAWLYDSYAAGLHIYLLVLFLYAVAATYNNLADRAVDTANKRMDNPFSIRQISIQTGYIWIAIMTAAAMLTLFFCRQPITFYLVFLYGLLLYAYSNSKLHLQARGLVAPLLLASCYSGLPYLMTIAQLHAIHLIDVSTAIFIVMISVSLLLAKDYKDIIGDKLHSKLTPLVRYGAVAVKRIALGVYFGCFTLLLSFYSLHYHEHTAAVLIGLLSAIVYGGCVLFIHSKQGQTPKHFLRLPQVALLITTISLVTITK